MFRKDLNSLVEAGLCHHGPLVDTPPAPKPSRPGKKGPGSSGGGFQGFAPGPGGGTGGGGYHPPIGWNPGDAGFSGGGGSGGGVGGGLGSPHTPNPPPGGGSKPCGYSGAYDIVRPPGCSPIDLPEIPRGHD